MGAEGYIFKADAAELTTALGAALEGKQYLSRELRSDVTRDAENGLGGFAGFFPWDLQKEKGVVR